MKIPKLPLLSLVTVAAALSLTAQQPATPPPTNAPAAEPAAENAAAPAAAAANSVIPNYPKTEVLPVLDRNADDVRTITGSLEAGRVANSIQSADIENRDTLVKELTQRIEIVEQALQRMRESTEITDEAREEVERATTLYNDMKSRLMQSIEEASNAEAGAAWERARSSVATNYAFFVSAVGSMEVALPN